MTCTASPYSFYRNTMGNVNVGYVEPKNYISAGIFPKVLEFGLSKFIGEDFDIIKPYIDNPKESLARAFNMLDDLNKGLPAALENMPPSLKDDIRKVNELVIDVCDKAVKGAKPAVSGTYAYSSFDMHVTCQFIKKHVPEISKGLDDPTIITDLIENLKKFSQPYINRL